MAVTAAAMSAGGLGDAPVEPADLADQIHGEPAQGAAARHRGGGSPRSSSAAALGGRVTLGTGRDEVGQQRHAGG